MKTTDRFAVTAENGRRYDLVERQEEIPAGDFQNPRDTLPGLKELRTTEGDRVNVEPDGTFVILTGGGYLRAVRDSN